MIQSRLLANHSAMKLPMEPSDTKFSKRLDELLIEVWDRQNQQFRNTYEPLTKLRLLGVEKMCQPPKMDWCCIIAIAHVVFG